MQILSALVHLLFLFASPDVAGPLLLSLCNTPTIAPVWKVYSCDEPSEWLQQTAEASVAILSCSGTSKRPSCNYNGTHILVEGFNALTVQYPKLYCLYCSDRMVAVRTAESCIKFWSPDRTKTPQRSEDCRAERGDGPRHCHWAISYKPGSL